MASPGASRPSGWIRDWSLAAASGYTGHMDLYDVEFRDAWKEGRRLTGDGLNWWKPSPLGSWSDEGGAYWFDGLVRLAWQLDDSKLKDLASCRMSPLLDGMQPNGVLFKWWLDRRDDEARRWVSEGPATWQMWAAGVSERPVAVWFAVTGDVRARRALEFAFDDPRLFAGASPLKAPIVGAVLEAAWLTDSELLMASADAVAKKLMPCFQIPPSPGLDSSLNMRRPEMDHMRVRPMRHGVSTSEALLSVIRAYSHTGRAELLSSVRAWLAFLDRHAMQPYGVTVSDEEWGWTGANRGSETCNVAAEAWTRTEMLMLTGEGSWGDQIERAFFNAAPACVSRDFRRHVYFQTANRTRADDFSETSVSQTFSKMKQVPTRFDEKHYPLCCTASLNRLVPNYVQAMWMKTEDGGIAATLYGPSSFRMELPVGTVVVREDTSYPFEDTITLIFESAPDDAFPLRLRVPGWCGSPSFSVNGKPVECGQDAGFMVMRRVWRKGDVVRMRFPMTPTMAETRDWNHGGELRRSISLGPLLMVQGHAELDENTPVGTVCEAELGRDALDVAKTVRRPMPEKWNWPYEAPVRIVVKSADGRPIELIPYGCAKLRTSMFAGPANE